MAELVEFMKAAVIVVGCACIIVVLISIVVFLIRDEMANWNKRNKITITEQDNPYGAVNLGTLFKRGK